MNCTGDVCDDAKHTNPGLVFLIFVSSVFAVLTLIALAYQIFEKYQSIPKISKEIEIPVANVVDSDQEVID
tara:strand:+ start:122 stop:334 length:213 start_codon:yes stop_codon:yes gene_type:complete